MTCGARAASRATARRPRARAARDSRDVDVAQVRVAVLEHVLGEARVAAAGHEDRVVLLDVLLHELLRGGFARSRRRGRGPPSEAPSTMSENPPSRRDAFHPGAAPRLDARVALVPVKGLGILRVALVPVGGLACGDDRVRGRRGKARGRVGADGAGPRRTEPWSCFKSSSAGAGGQPTFCWLVKTLGDRGNSDGIGDLWQSSEIVSIDRMSAASGANWGSNASGARARPTPSDARRRRRARRRSSRCHGEAARHHDAARRRRRKRNPGRRAPRRRATGPLARAAARPGRAPAPPRLTAGPPGTPRTASRSRRTTAR